MAWRPLVAWVNDLVCDPVALEFKLLQFEAQLGPSSGRSEMSLASSAVDCSLVDRVAQALRIPRG
jgi:hypothetical protein